MRLLHKRLKIVKIGHRHSNNIRVSFVASPASILLEQASSAATEILEG